MNPEIFLCPWCRQQCDVGWDCACGAKALASDFYVTPDRPAMQAQGTSPLGAICAVMARRSDGTYRPDGPVREMIPAGAAPPVGDDVRSL